MKLSARDATDFLLREYPAAFSTDARTPLKVGIHRDIAARGIGVSETSLKSALRAWATHPAYVANVRNRKPRLDLAGVPGELPTEQEAAHARGQASAKAKPRLGKAERKDPDFVRAAAIRRDAAPGEDLAGDDLAFMHSVLDRHLEGRAKRLGSTGIRVIGVLGVQALAVSFGPDRAERFSLLKCFAAPESRPAEAAA